MHKHLRRLSVVVTAFALLALATGSSQKYSAERVCKKLGEAICDVRNADNKQDAQKALSKAKEQLNDLGSKHAIYTAEDRADLQNNFADLAEHTAQGNDVLREQDLAVIQRSIHNIAKDSTETSQAAWEGVQEGLSECN